MRTHQIVFSAIIIVMVMIGPILFRMWLETLVSCK